SVLLLGSVYGLGKHLLGGVVGVWAATLCVLFPRFYQVRSHYLLDYPLVAWVVATFWCLTVWRDAKGGLRQWGWTVGLGLSLGLTLMTKQTSVLYLAVPLLWAGLETLWQRAWGRSLQLLVSLGIAGLIVWPWLSKNWIFQLSAWTDANVQAAQSEGDPSVATAAAWLHYWADLPAALSWPLLIVPLVGLLLGLLLGWRGLLRTDRDRPSSVYGTGAAFRWLGVFLVSSYLLLSAIQNKDPRYIMPVHAVLAVVLGYGLKRWGDWSGRWVRWGRRIPWGTVGLATVLMVLNLFAIAPWAAPMAALLSPEGPHYAAGDRFPHEQVIDAIIRTEPYQRANLGVLHATATINQHNFNYYGNQRNFQVYARRLGNEDDYLEQDVRSLSWFVAQSGRVRGETKSVRHTRAKLLRLAQQDGTFRLQQSWPLPNGEQLQLYHRQVPLVEVKPVEAEPGAGQSIQDAVQLMRVTVPSQTPPGVPIPVTYEWAGSWQALRHGLVLLTWRGANQTAWIHDHGIGLGTLHPGPIQANQVIEGADAIAPDQRFAVIERTAMRSPQNAAAGVYTLEATYLDRRTGETYPIAIPAVTLTIDPVAIASPAPVVDWVSQLRDQGRSLPEGLSALEEVFEVLGRLNLYDPIQNYIVQAEETLAYRFQHETPSPEVGYALALTQVMQRQAKGAIATLERVAQLDPDNPYVHAYLGFVNLYAFRPKAADAALTTARALDPDSREIQGLSAVAALMRGHLWQAWQTGAPLLSKQSS
ncbi:MAG TPA: phospholipid carrier-dependent glycosyltransferase, partial [Chroococcidiopsis sp.]